MKSLTSHSAAPAPAAAAPSYDLPTRLSRLYRLAQSSDFLFGSPLDLSTIEPTPDVATLPRFVYFGPQTSDVAPRLAIISGLGRHDRPASLALTAFVEGLAQHPDLGHALNLSFFPVVNVFGLLGGAEERDLTAESWSRSTAPELVLLAQDARLRAYHGYIRILTTDDDEPSARLCMVRSLFAATSAIGVFDSTDFEPWPVSFEILPGHAALAGPLALGDDLAFAPFEVELALPADWNQARSDDALAILLKRLVTRYRGFLAYGQHL